MVGSLEIVFDHGIMSGGFWVNIWHCHRAIRYLYGETSEDADGPRFGGYPYDPRDPVERELRNGYIKKKNRSVHGQK